MLAVLYPSEGDVAPDRPFASAIAFNLLSNFFADGTALALATKARIAQLGAWFGHSIAFSLLQLVLSGIFVGCAFREICVATKRKATMNENFATLAARTEAAIGPANLTPKRMFGGIAFLLNGNMLCCVSRRGLMVRVGAAAEVKALASPHASPCRVTGRPMPGFIMVEASAFATEADLARWIGMARAYVETLPPKPEKAPQPKSASPRSKRRKTGRA